MPRSLLVGSSFGAIGGFDGFACQTTETTSCNGAPCGATDAFVAFMSGDRCEHVIYVGGSLGDTIFGAAFARYAPEREYLVLAGRTASGDLKPRAAIQTSPGQVVGNGVDAFYAVIDTHLKSLRILSYLGDAPELTSPLTSSDDVATSVALGPDREATLTGMTRTAFADFQRKMGPHTPAHTPEAGQAFVVRLPVEVADLSAIVHIDKPVLTHDATTDVSIEVKNEGTIDARDVSVRLELDPDGLTVVSSPNGCTPMASPLSWTCRPPAGLVEEGTSVYFIFVLKAPAKNGEHFFQGEVTATSPDPNADNNHFVDRVRVGGIDFLPRMVPETPTPDPAVVGTHESALVAGFVINRGVELARARVEVTASQPLIVAVAPDVTGCTATACGEGKTCLPLTCDGPLQNNETASVGWLAKVLSLALLEPYSVQGPETTVIVTAKTSALDGKTDSFTSNDTTSLPITFRKPDIVAVSAAFTPRIVPWAGAATLTVVARDDGPGHVDSVEVSFDPSPFTPGTLPEGCTFDSNLLWCALFRPEQGALPVGHIYSIDIPLVAPAKDDTQVAREVTLGTTWRGAGADPKPINNSASAKAWLGAVDVRVEPPPIPPPYRTFVDEDVVWTIRNHASDPATNVNLSMLLAHPAGVEVVNAKFRGTTDCTKATTGEGTFLVCAIGNLAAGEAVTLETLVNARGRGDIVHTLEVETAEENASKALYPMKQTYAALGPDLVTTIAPPLNAFRDERATLTVSVANAGKGASPPSGSRLVVDLPFAASELTSSNSDMGCTGEEVALVGGKRGTRVQCTLAFFGIDNQSYTTELGFKPKSKGAHSVTAKATDPNEEKPADNDRAVVLQVAGADLSATMTIPDKVEIGQSFDVSLRVANQGPAAAKQALPRLVLPSDRLEVVGSLPTGCSNVDGVIDCHVEIRPGDESTLTVSVRGRKLGAARVASRVKQTDSEESTIGGHNDIEVVGPDLEVAHVATRPSAWLTPPQSGEVDFRVGNRSTTAAEGVPVVMRVASSQGQQQCSTPHDPVTAAVVSGDCSSGATAGAFTCNLQPGAEAILRFSATAACVGKTELEVTANAGRPELDTANNRATSTILVREPKLGLAFEPDPITGAAAIEGPYESSFDGLLTARDLSGYGVGAGPNPDDKIRVDLFAPSPFKVEQLTTNGGTCHLPTAQSPAHCLLDSIGQSASVSIAFAVRSTHGPARALIRAVASGVAIEDTSASAELVATGPDLSVSVLSAPAGKVVDDRGEWVVQVSNLGVAAAEHPAIAFTEPAGLIDMITVDGTTSCSSTAAGRVCTLAGPIDGAASVNVTFGARLKKPGDLVIPVRVTSRYEPDEVAANNAASLSTRVLGPDLAVTLALAPDTANAGEAVNLQLSVQNVGSVASDATTATIQLGALVSVSSLAPGCTLQQGVAHCALPSLSPAQTEVFSSQIAGTRAGTIALSAQARVSGDGDPLNDRSSATLTITSADSDGDGTPDSVEDQGPNGGDANGDGVADSAQPHVTTIVIPRYGAFIAESLTANTILELVPRANPSPLPAGHRAPLAPDGTFGFRVRGVAPGALATVRFTFPAGVPAHSWWKVDAGPPAIWSEFNWNGVTGARAVSARVLEVTVQDDGRGDEDPTDGVIEDPGTPLLPVITVADAGDADDADPGDGDCATAGGTCTLRAALTELNAGGEPRYVVFEFSEATTIQPATPLPTLTTPAVIDGAEVPGPTASEPGLTLSGAGLTGGGRLLGFGVEACALVGVKLRDVGGHGLEVSRPAARVADSWLGRPLYGAGGEPAEHAALFATGADALMVTGVWVGRINGIARYGLDLAGADMRVEDVRVNVSPADGLRLFGDVPTGLRLRDAVRARIERVVVNGANVAVHASGDGTGAILRESLFGLGANGKCNAFTRDDPGPAEDGRGPCLERNLTGLLLDGAHGWTIGGLEPADGNAFGDHYDSILVTAGAHHNHFYSNLIGLAGDGTCQPSPDLGTATLYDGLCRLYNVRGLAISGGHDNVVGAPGAGNFFGVGTLEISGEQSTDNVVRSNFIGLFSDLVTPVRPGFTAQIQTHFQVSGGAAGTLIDDNTMSGLFVLGAGTDDTVITHNRIGLLPSGLALPGPDTDFDTYWRVWPSGVLIQDGPTRVTLSDNTIADNIDACVRVESLEGRPVTNVELRDNLVGLTADGRGVTVCRGGAVDVRGVEGVVVEGNVIGHCGSEASATFGLACVRLGGGARATDVRANVFGLLRDGRAGPFGPVAPLLNPVVVLDEAPASIIADNFMLGTPPYAIYDRGAFFGGPAAPADGARIVGNRIGVDPDGARRGAPTDHGIPAVGAHARIGGIASGEGNLIVGAGGAGIRVGAVTGVAVRGNLLEENAGLGVSLGGTSPVANDSLDGDGGPNGSQNHPLVGAFDASSTSVAVSLSSAASSSYSIDVYGVTAPDPSGHGEADVFLGTATLTTDASGQGQISVALERAPNPGESLTAIATGPDGSSEFGPSVVPVAGPEADLALTLYGEGAAVDAWGYVQATVVNEGPDTAAGLVVAIDLPPGLELGAESWISSGACTPRAGGLDCVPPDLGPFEVWEVAYLVRSAVAGSYAVTATIDSASRDPDASDDRAEAEVLVGPVRYLIQQTNYTNYRTYTTGEDVPITSTVACYPGFMGTLTDLEIAIDVPPGTSVTASTPACTVAGERITCAMGDLVCTSGFPVNTATLAISVAFSRGGTHALVVEATTPAPNIEGRQVITLPDLTVVAPPPALAIALSGPSEAVPSGALETWTATLSNSGAVALDGVQVFLTPPPGMRFRGAEAPCAPLGDAVVCLPASIPAAGSLPIALAFEAPPAGGTLTACARRVSGDTVLEEPCVDLAVAITPFNRAVGTATPVVSTPAGSPTSLVFSVTSATGAPPSTLVLTPSVTVDSVDAPACAPVEGTWRCALDAIPQGGEARVVLELAQDGAAAISWQASLADADADPLDDSASATVLVAAQGQCAPWAEVLGFAESTATPPAAVGFGPATPSAAAPLGWRLEASSGSLTTPVVGVPAETEALWVSWFDAGAFPEGVVGSVELSIDGGQSWSEIQRVTAAGEVAPHLLRVDRATLGLGDDPISARLRWRIDGAEPNAWQLGQLRVTSCQPAATAFEVSVVAEPSFASAPIDTPLSTVFRVRNETVSSLDGARLDLKLDAPETLRDASVEGGVCTLVASGVSCALPPIDAEGEVEVVISGASLIDLRVGVSATLRAPSTLTGTPRAAASWRFGAPPGEGASLTWRPGEVAVAVRASAAAELEVAGVGGDVFPGGVVTLRPAPGLSVTPGSSDCGLAGDVLMCDVPPLAPGQTHRLPVGLNPTGAERSEVVSADWASADGAASADLIVHVEMGGALDLQFVEPDPVPAALTPAAVSLRVSATDDVAAGARIVISPSLGVSLSAVTAPGATCAVSPSLAACDLPAIGDGATLAFSLEVVVADAGAHALVAALERGPAGTSPSAELRWTSSRDCETHPCAGDPCLLATCDAALGCLTTPREGEACDPGLPCERDGVCAAGACVAVGGACPGEDVCEAWQLDCDDGDACTEDACLPFVGCVHTPSGECCAPSDCADDGDPCTVATCEAGTCGTSPAADETPCDADGDLCTNGDACQTGTCTAGPALDCDDGDVCTSDSCDASTGCVNTPIAGCCRTDPDCAGLAPVCQSASCDTGTGQCVLAPLPDGAPCDADGSVCTEADRCVSGACAAGPALACDDGNACTSDGCDSSEGCTHAPIPDCCTTAADCPAPAESCRVAACDGETRRCTSAPAADGTPCDADSDACTEDDACLTGACAPGAARDCDDGDPCTLDACEPEVGCTHVAIDEGSCACAPLEASAACQDGDLVWSDGCGATGAVAVECDDGGAGTEDRCDAELGVCLRVPAGRDDCDTACDGEWSAVCGERHVLWRDPCGLDAGIAAVCASADPCAAVRCDAEQVACVVGVSDAAECRPDGGCDATRSLACEGAELVWRDGCGERVGLAMACDDGDPTTDDRCDGELLACVRTPVLEELPDRLCESEPVEGGPVEAVEAVEAVEPMEPVDAGGEDVTGGADAGDTAEGVADAPPVQGSTDGCGCNASGGGPGNAVLGLLTILALALLRRHGSLG